MRSNDFGKKPDNTKIQLTKSGEFFEVYIPPLGFQPEMLSLFILIAPVHGLINFCAWMDTQALFSKNISSTICLPLVGALVCLIVCRCFFVLFHETYFRIERQEISLIKTIFGIKINCELLNPMLKHEITKLIFTHANMNVSFKIKVGGRLMVFSPKNNEKVYAAFKIEIGRASIVFGGRGGRIQLEDEVAWLAYEVSEWLDKPLKIY